LSSLGDSEVCFSSHAPFIAKVAYETIFKQTSFSVTPYFKNVFFNIAQIFQKSTKKRLFFRFMTCGETENVLIKTAETIKRQKKSISAQ